MLPTDQADHGSGTSAELTTATTYPFNMPGKSCGRRKMKVVHMSSPTPTQVDVDPIFFSQTFSPQALVLAPATTAHSQSKTWKSDDAKDKEQYARLSTLLHHFVPESPFVPRTYAVWVEHRALINAMEMDSMKKTIALKESRSTEAAKIAIKPLFEGKMLSDNRSAVLGHKTIWAAWATPTDQHPQALWPDRSEFQYEGDDRSRSSMGRFLPLPRMPGNETVNWKAREHLLPYRPLDHVGMLKENGRPDVEMRQSNDEMYPGEGHEELVTVLLSQELLAELE